MVVVSFEHGTEVTADVLENALNIKIRATDGSEVFFKIKKTTKLNKLKVHIIRVHWCANNVERLC